MQANTREFQISGSWSDPKVERMERKLNEALPDIKLPESKPELKSERRPEAASRLGQIEAAQVEPPSAATSSPLPVPVLQ